ncbi:hypothetical protein [Prochlorothrix hollandica]|uniref:hypothetical protein n=1 Tax=Prochlorothrix hollandica TaxID=1223 RepID=UPI003342A417
MADPSLAQVRDPGQSPAGLWGKLPDQSLGTVPGTLAPSAGDPPRSPPYYRRYIIAALQ